MFYRPNEDPIQVEDIRKSGLKPDLLSPDRNFVTNFYVENTPETETEIELAPEFYRRLDEAIEVEQWEDGLERLRRKIDDFHELSKEKAA
jgi:hypothetical protein